MFTIIGADGNEYGPASAETVKQWIAAGRADGHTKARREGETDWIPLEKIPEFADVFAAAPATSPTPEPGIGVDPKSFAADLVARSGGLDIGSCYNRSWELLKANYWPLVGVTFVVVFLVAAGGSIPVVDILVSLLLTGVFYGGLFGYYLAKIRGQPANFGDAFNGFSVALVPLMLATLVSSLLILAGFLLLILPGIYLAVAYMFTYLLIFDKKLEFWTAMEVSRRVITAHWWQMFGMVLVAVGVSLLGCLLLIVGVFLISMPLTFGAIAYAYEDLCNPLAKAE
ncbi:MAG: DUF4339 domain-containing protein [Opitutaceae bacterium]|nr:DUF4339 domain-containing protein [Opitutaceae bacterium]